VPADYKRASQLALETIRMVLAAGIKGGEVININIPDLTKGTPRGVRVVPQAIRTMKDEFTRHRAGSVPLGRMEKAEDVAHVIAFLAGPRSGYMTGQALSVDGGLVMH
jgi:NAD(P)-dependent dehydrogenase (short-subunit alcohol dehydrogenase family)